MAIYRGTGGSAEATNNATVNEVAGYATDAETSATNAASSATSAASSATSASSSATASASSATASESSATASATSASASATSASNASTSASQAASSASAASTSASNASTSETNAASSETAAASSASSAATSATSAATSASNASTSETNAATSASNASTSETNAATSASEAAASAASIVSDELESAANAAAAAQSYDNFDDRYLGAKASDPTVDNDGDALITGAMYFDSSNNVMKVYSGSEWQNASSSIEGIKSDFVYTATASQTLFSGADDNTDTLVIDKAGLVNVYLNGVRLADSDYTVDVGANSITLASGAALNDVVEIEVFGNFAGQSGADVAITGGSITGLTELSTGTFTSTGIDDNATSTAITIDASENVGIGTASPSAQLHIDGQSNGTLRVDTTANGYLDLSMYSNGAFIGTSGAEALRLGTVGTERARIDSSGNLLVGMTSPDISTAGVALHSDGKSFFTRDSTFPTAYFNKLNNDGDILNFRKDGSTVGSIGTKYDATYIAGAGSGAFFNSNGLIPFGSSDVSDNTHDLGQSGNRWKDLYLSGGVVFDDAGGSGTSTSNTLDSYEEGTWTALAANAEVNTTYSDCRYTKVGNVVYVRAYFKIQRIASSASALAISGLPFTSADAGTFTLNRFEPTGWQYQVIQPYSSQTTLYFSRPSHDTDMRVYNSINNDGTMLTVDDMSTTTNSNLHGVMLAGWYTVA